MSTERPSPELPSVSTSLLERVQQMEPDAWARLVDVFGPIVYRWSRHAGLKPSDSADVVQEVFMAVARNVDRFQRQKQVASFRSWLATITRNRVRDQFRRTKIHPVAEGGTAALNQMGALQQITEQADLEHDLDQSISLADLDRSIPKRILEIVRRECDERTWQAFWLTTVQGDAAQDVAARIGMNVASVYQAKTRMLRRIRKKLAELPD